MSNVQTKQSKGGSYQPRRTRKQRWLRSVKSIARSLARVTTPEGNSLRDDVVKIEWERLNEHDLYKVYRLLQKSRDAISLGIDAATSHRVPEQEVAKVESREERRVRREVRAAAQNEEARQKAKGQDLGEEYDSPLYIR